MPPAIQAAMSMPMDMMMSRAGRAGVIAPCIPSSMSCQEKRCRAPTAAAKTAASSRGTWGALPSTAVKDTTRAMSTPKVRRDSQKPTGLDTLFFVFNSNSSSKAKVY